MKTNRFTSILYIGGNYRANKNKIIYSLSLKKKDSDL